jgi:hypothetical protein
MRVRARFGGCLHGGVTEEVLARCSAPLLVIPGAHGCQQWLGADTHTWNRRVLVLVAQGQPVALAMCIARTLSQALGGELRLIKVSASPQLHLPHPARPVLCSQADPCSRARISLHLPAATITEWPELRPQQLAVRPDCWANIVTEIINTHQPSMVVMVTNGRSTSQFLPFEAIAGVILRGKRIPLVMVPQPYDRRAVVRRSGTVLGVAPQGADGRAQDLSVTIAWLAESGVTSRQRPATS